MHNDYKVYDNVLPKEEFDKIKQILLGNDFPWFFLSYKVDDYQPWAEDDKHNFQFTHNFYSEHSPKSQYIKIIEPIIKLLNPTAIVRIKGNLTPVTPKIIEYGYHTDNDFYGDVAVFYVNTNDGYTVFDDGTKIESIENRLLVFNSRLYHTGTSCTDQKVRCVLNFNFYSK